MKVQRFILGPLSTNCYIIETKNKNAAAIDIGGDYDKIKDYLETNGLKLKKYFLLMVITTISEEQPTLL